MSEEAVTRLTEAARPEIMRLKGEAKLEAVRRLGAKSQEIVLGLPAEPADLLRKQKLPEHGRG